MDCGKTYSDAPSYCRFCGGRNLERRDDLPEMMGAILGFPMGPSGEPPKGGDVPC